MKKAVILLLTAVLCLNACSRRPERIPAEETPPPTAAATPTPTPTPCAHAEWSEGICTECGEVCAHESRERGVCTRCGMKCTHPGHDADGRCSVCGMTVPHRYEKSVCVDCGHALTFESDAIDEKWWSPDCPEKGTIIELSYTATDYLKNAENGITMPICVYLPYGYDPAEQYDLLILLHGAGSYENNNYRSWLAEPHLYRDSTVCVADLIDNLIYAGECGKLVVAAPTYYRLDENGDKHFYNMTKAGTGFTEALRQDILPCICENLSTYAADGSEAAMRAARDHIGFLGLSQGSVIGYNTVLAQCSDLFAWVGCMGSFGYSEVFGRTAYVVNSGLSDERFADCPIRYLYNSGGADDPSWWEQQSYCEILFSASDKLTVGENSSLVTVENAAHNYATWDQGVFNCLHIFFTLPE